MHRKVRSCILQQGSRPYQELFFQSWESKIVPSRRMYIPNCGSEESVSCGSTDLPQILLLCSRTHAELFRIRSTLQFH